MASVHQRYCGSSSRRQLRRSALVAGERSRRRAGDQRRGGAGPAPGSSRRAAARRRGGAPPSRCAPARLAELVGRRGTAPAAAGRCRGRRRGPSSGTGSKSAQARSTVSPLVVEEQHADRAVVARPAGWRGCTGTASDAPCIARRRRRDRAARPRARRPRGRRLDHLELAGLEGAQEGGHHLGVEAGAGELGDGLDRVLRL